MTFGIDENGKFLNIFGVQEGGGSAEGCAKLAADNTFTGVNTFDDAILTDEIDDSTGINVVSVADDGTRKVGSVLKGLKLATNANIEVRKGTEENISYVVTTQDTATVSSAGVVKVGDGLSITNGSLAISSTYIANYSTVGSPSISNYVFTPNNGYNYVTFSPFGGTIPDEYEITIKGTYPSNANYRVMLGAKTSTNENIQLLKQYIYRGDPYLGVWTSSTDDIGAHFWQGYSLPFWGRIKVTSNNCKVMFVLDNNYTFATLPVEGRWDTLVDNNSTFTSVAKTITEPFIVGVNPDTTYSQQYWNSAINLDEIYVKVGSDVIYSGVIQPLKATSSTYGLVKVDGTSITANKGVISSNLTTYSGYDATKTQVLKNVQGTLTWVDEA